MVSLKEWKGLCKRFDWEAVVVGQWEREEERSLSSSRNGPDLYILVSLLGAAPCHQSRQDFLPILTYET